MEEKYKSESENQDEEDGSKDHEENVSNKKFRVRKKQLYIKLLKQMEFYFSPSNIARDRFIGQLIKDDPYIPISTFLTFNKIKEIFRHNMIAEEKQVHELAKSISKSEMLELSEDKTKVRLKADLPTKTQEEIDECTIYVEQIPLNSTHESLTSIFSKYGKVAYISLPRYAKSRQIKQFCFIEFQNSASVQNVLTGFKKFDAVLQFNSVKAENLLSISTFNEQKDNDHEPPAKRIKLNTADDGGDDKEKIEENKEASHEEKEEEEEEEETNQEEEEADKNEESTGSEAKKKKLRKHKRNQSKKKFIDERMMAMKVLKKSDWKKIRNSYLNLERQKAKEIKKILRESYNKRNDHKNPPLLPTSTKASPKINFYGSPNPCEETPEQAADLIFENQSGKLNYTPGCIVNIKFREPCIDSKEFKKELKQFPDVEYVDILEGGSQCFIRVSQTNAAHELISHYSSCEYETEILKDEPEKEYWKKIFDNREKKKKNKDNNKNVVEKRHRKRGREKLVIKISKATQNQIIRFNDVEEHHTE